MTLNPYFKRIYSLILFLLPLVFALQSSAFAADGEKLFKANCAACHRTTEKKLVGPGLKDLKTRIPSGDWIYNWTHNPKGMIDAGDAYAKKISEEYSASGVMTAFPALSNEEIDAILAYIEEEGKKLPITPSGQELKEDVSGQSSTHDPNAIDTTYILIGLFVVLAILFFVLGSIKKSLQDAVDKKRGLEPTPTLGPLDSFISWFNKNKRLTALGVIVLALWGMKGCWDSLYVIGVNEGYQPDQPIAYSHKVHAGENGIACVYCHFGAEKSKTAGVPSANVCMNCHKAIQEGTKTGSKEISKIYAALDYDPNTQKYGPNQKPIEWVRIHNLPDLAYFNHSQHVTVGKIECQKCHGPIETMDKVAQFAPLTMKWCIECHRESEVKMAENPYYEDFHKNLKERFAKEGNADKKITVATMGGTECQKCHY